MPRACWLAVLGLLVVLLPRGAGAAEGERIEVSFEMEGEGGAAPVAPSAVCVISDGKGESQRSMAELVAALQAKGAHEGTVTDARLQSIIPAGAAWKELDPRQQALAWMLPGNHLGTMKGSALVPALERNRPACDASASPTPWACVARLSGVSGLAGHGYTCAINTQRAEAEPSVLWLELTANKDTGDPSTVALALDKVVLNGDTLTVETNLVPSLVKSAQVVGGHYLESPTRVEAKKDGRIALSLVPRCRWTTVDLPPVGPLGALRAEGDGEDETDSRLRLWLQRDAVPLRIDSARCVRGDLGTDVQVLLPRPADGDVLRAVIEQDLPEGYEWYEPKGKGGGKDPPGDVQEEGGASVEPSSNNALTFSARPRVEPWTAGRISMVTRSLTFFWPREPCFYPTECPEARVYGGRGSCTQAELPNKDDDEGEPEGSSQDEVAGCYYRCELHSPISSEADLPIPVTLRGRIDVNPPPEWTTDVHRLNDYVSQGLEDEDRYIRLDLSAWTNKWGIGRSAKGAAGEHPNAFEHTIGRVLPDTRAKPPTRKTRREQRLELWQTNDDQIERIELTDSQGRTQTIALDLYPKIDGADHLHYVHIPGVSCEEGLELELVGQRGFRAEPVIVDGGKIVVKHPMALARRVHIGVGVDVVGLVPVRPGEIRGAARIRPAIIVDPVIVRLKPRVRALRSFRFDLPRVELMLSEVPYLPLDAEPGRSRETAEYRGLFMRGLFTFVARSPEVTVDALGLSFSGALGASLGTGRPLLKADERYVGRMDMSYGVLAEAPIRIGRIFELRPSARLLCGEDLHRYATDLRGVAEDRTREDAMCTLVFGGGAALTF